MIELCDCKECRADRAKQLRIAGTEPGQLFDQALSELLERADRLEHEMCRMGGGVPDGSGAIMALLQAACRAGVARGVPGGRIMRATSIAYSGEVCFARAVKEAGH